MSPMKMMDQNSIPRIWTPALEIGILSRLNVLLEFVMIFMSLMFEW